MGSTYHNHHRGDPAFGRGNHRLRPHGRELAQPRFHTECNLNDQDADKVVRRPAQQPLAICGTEDAHHQRDEQPSHHERREDVQPLSHARGVVPHPNRPDKLKVHRNHQCEAQPTEAAAIVRRQGIAGRTGAGHPRDQKHQAEQDLGEHAVPLRQLDAEGFLQAKLTIQ